MNKTKAVVYILLVAPLLGAIYGVLHDQITYSISEEYYSKFKFIQFKLDTWPSAENIGTGKAPEIKLANPRLGAAAVGALATWWVGLIAGGLLSLVGLRHRNGYDMLKTTLKAIVLNVTIALFIGLIGLAVGGFFLNGNNLSSYVPDNVTDPESFISVGMMHNFSYLGGAIGLVVAIFYSVRRKNKYLRQAT